MNFDGLHPLTEAFPHVELRSGPFLFDIHNAAVLTRMGLDFKGRRFDVEWLVENLLEDARSGPYRTACVVLTVAGIDEFSASGQLEPEPGEPAGIDFIEYVPAGGGTGVLRLVFTSSGELSLSGTHCTLGFTVLS